MNEWFQSRIGICKDKNSNAIGEKDGIMGRWAEHFSELLNIENDENDEVKIETQYTEIYTIYTMGRTFW